MTSPRQKKQSRLTLIEIVFVVGIASGITFLGFLQKSSDFESRKLREVGSIISRYNTAVESWMADNPVPMMTGSIQGTNWLKVNTCNTGEGTGGSIKPYLPCDFPNATTANPVVVGNIVFTIDLTTTGVAPDHTTSVEIVTTEF